MRLEFRGTGGVILEVGEGYFFYKDAQRAIFADYENLEPTFKAVLNQFAEDIARRGEHLADRARVGALRAGADPECTCTVRGYTGKEAAEEAEKLFSSASGVPLRAGGFSRGGRFTANHLADR
ncbi:hypothetical protein [Geobacter sp. DSM 9736]|uniref:hypothetical protein n=1 Tax=Geobacter sp. DSM 9736 TaxID=1277350 RepID=UPI000B50DCB4|nr:hypothetical protein [Geobacter sp. DSM 9736]SNB45700.1 hypothetical protein SAMN06269301_1128 [Geobacter sp. DSM 9736]